MGRYLICGAGKFGRLAAARLAALDPGGTFLVVDRDPEALKTLPGHGLAAPKTRVGDAAAVLAEVLGEDPTWDWIVPMVPGHLACRWLLAGPLQGQGWAPVAVPPRVKEAAPWSWEGPEGEIYLSRAGHVCPDDCAEPECCPVTGESREPPLFAALAALAVPGWRVLVLASRQVAPGVGGYPPRDLLRLAGEFDGAAGKILLATACRCHGVVHGITRQGDGAG